MAPLSAATNVVALRRRIHARPEAGFLEFRTAALVADQLGQLGFELFLGEEAMDPGLRMGVPPAAVLDGELALAEEDGVGTRCLDSFRGGMTAVVGVIEGRRPGGTVAFRFDLDALPVEEPDDGDHLPAKLGFRSRREGLMHACGHDGHTAIGLALAQRLSDRDFAGRVKLVFQPAEEGLRGAAAVAGSGQLDDVDRLYGLHLGLGLPTGTVFGATDGLLASSKFRASFLGRSSHAGMEPERGANALLAAAQAVTAVHALPQYAGEGSKLNVGSFRSGEAANIVAARAELVFETRAPTATVENGLAESARQAMTAAGMGLGVAVEIEPMGGAPELVCDVEPAAEVVRCARAVDGLTPGEGAHVDSGSEDASWLLERVRDAGGDGTYIAFGCSSPGGHHNPRFDLDEAALPLAVDLLERVARSPLG